MNTTAGVAFLATAVNAFDVCSGEHVHVPWQDFSPAANPAQQRAKQFPIIHILRDQRISKLLSTEIHGYTYPFKKMQWNCLLDLEGEGAGEAEGGAPCFEGKDDGLFVAADEGEGAVAAVTVGQVELDGELDDAF